MFRNIPSHPPPWRLQEPVHIHDAPHVYPDGHFEDELFPTPYHTYDLDPVSWEEGLRAIDEFDWSNDKEDGSVEQPGHDTQVLGKAPTFGSIPFRTAGVVKEEEDKIHHGTESPAQTQGTGSISSEPNEDALSSGASLVDSSGHESWYAQLRDAINGVAQLSARNDSTPDQDMSSELSEPPSPILEPAYDTTQAPSLPIAVYDVLLGNLESDAVMDYFPGGVNPDPFIGASEADDEDSDEPPKKKVKLNKSDSEEGEGDVGVPPRTPATQAVLPRMYTRPSKPQRKLSDSTLGRISSIAPREKPLPLARQLFPSAKKQDVPLTLASCMDSPLALGPRTPAPHAQSEPEGSEPAHNTRSAPRTRSATRKGKAPAEEQHRAEVSSSKEEQSSGTPPSSGKKNKYGLRMR